MAESRYRKYDTRRLPKEKRTISLFGATSYINGRVVKDQSNVFYRCWNCGFVCRTDRDQLGNGEGFYITDEADKYSYNQGAAAFQYPCSNASEQAIQIVVRTPSTVMMMQLDDLGKPVTIEHNNIQVVTSGCPACGCRQYKN